MLRPLEPSGLTDRCAGFVDLLQTVNVIAVVIDQRGEILHINDYFLTLTGWTLPEVCGQNWQQMFAPPGIGSLCGLLDDLLSEKPGCWHEENEVVTRSGEHLFVRWSNIFFKDASGCVVAAGLIGENVSERVLLQRKLVEVSAHERMALQQELHDGLGQQLFGLSMSAASLATRTERGMQVTAPDLMELATSASHAMETCRRISHNVALTSEHRGDLLGALKRLMQMPADWQGPHLIFTSMVLNSVQLSADATEQLYKIAQEALTNALKHARARTIELRINFRATRIVMDVLDDGIGFVEDRTAAGLGLILMEHRAGLLHAVFEVAKRKEGGTAVHVRCTVAGNKAP